MKKTDRIKLTIDWDTEQDDGTHPTVKACGLPKQVYITRGEYEESEEGAIADWLSDEYGYCVNGVIISDPKIKQRRK